MEVVGWRSVLGRVGMEGEVRRPFEGELTQELLYCAAVFLIGAPYL